jgi:hypothetical protein
MAGCTDLVAIAANTSSPTFPPKTIHGLDTVLENPPGNNSLHRFRVMASHPGPPVLQERDPQHSRVNLGGWGNERIMFAR